MATTPKRKLSVLKRDRQSEKKNLRNRSVLSEVKTLSKKAQAAIESKKSDDIAPAVKDAVKSIGSAKAKGVLHANTAARKISRMMKKADAAVKSGAA